MSISLNITESDLINDLKVVTPSLFEDQRGFIWTSYNSESLDSLLPNNLTFKHDKFTQSKSNVLRGIHGDNKSWKLVSCVSGSILQVVVDMRENSRTYLKWQCFDLGESNRSMILIPPGLGNAFYVNSDSAIYHYKLAYPGEYIDSEEQFTVAWNDTRLNISWPTKNPILSERDGRF